MSAASTSNRPYRRPSPSSDRSKPAPATAAPRRSREPADWSPRRSPPASRPANPPAHRTTGQTTRRTHGAPPRGSAPAGANRDRPEPRILFQQYFKSVGPRTYAAQVKQASNGNHFVVLTEGKRDPATGAVKKISLYIYSEDFAEYFNLIKATADFVKANPVPAAVQRRQAAYWKRQNTTASGEACG